MYKIQVESDDVEFELSGEAPQFGKDVTLADRESDVLGAADWYKRGYTVAMLFTPQEKELISSVITDTVRDVLRQQNVGGLDQFTLDKYHHFIKGADDLHQRVIEVTRELRMENIAFDWDSLVQRISRCANHPFKAVNDVLGHSFLIVRINRPQSSDYNPPHKDGYLDVWKRTINVWIPIAGVTANSTLPVVPESHLMPESKIRRTVAGALLNGRAYRVPAVVEWNGDNRMIRPAIGPCEGLLFSPLIIHGCAKNFEPDTTRVALELRLSSVT